MYKTLLHVNLLFLPVLLGAQTAPDYFHRGAQFYIHNQKQKATNEIYTGLRLFPDDPQLRALAGLIKQEDEQQQQQQQQQQKNEDSKEQQQEQKSQEQQAQQPEQKKDQSEQNQEEKQQQQQADQSQQPKDPQDQKKESAQGAGGKEEQNADKEEEQAAAPGQMTPQEAKQLLDTQKQEEKMLPVKPNTKRAERKRPLRDW